MRGRPVIGTKECQHCRAILGTVYKGELYSIVRPYWSPEDVPQERWQYYDLTVLGSEGIERRHGWIDSETRLLLQTG